MIKKRRCGSKDHAFSGYKMETEIQDFFIVMLPTGSEGILSRGGGMRMGCGRRMRQYFQEF